MVYPPFAATVSSVPAFRLWLVQTLRQTAWAPLAVLVFHYIIRHTLYREAMDNPIHFLGGAAIAFFLLRAIILAAPLIGSFHPLVSYLFAFASASSVAAFWEIAEFASDQIRKTHVQGSLYETMFDLVFGVVGAAIVLLIVALFQCRRSQRERHLTHQ